MAGLSGFPPQLSATGQKIVPVGRVGTVHGREVFFNHWAPRILNALAEERCCGLRYFAQANVVHVTCAVDMDTDGFRTRWKLFFASQRDSECACNKVEHRRRVPRVRPQRCLFTVFVRVFGKLDDVVRRSAPLAPSNFRGGYHLACAGSAPAHYFDSDLQHNEYAAGVVERFLPCEVGQF